MNNIKEILQSLTIEEIQEQLDLPHNYISLWVNIFNSGFTVEILSQDWTYHREKNNIDNGMIFTDKDNFMILLQENNIEL